MTEITATGLAETGAAAAGSGRRWRDILLAAVVVTSLVLLLVLSRSTLTESISSFGHLKWKWVGLALFAEFGSMTAVARIQRRLLRAGGTRLALGSVMAVAYAGNAISVSLPLAGPQVATAYQFRQFGRRGIEAAVAAWALAVSGILSSLAFAFILAGGGIAWGSTTSVAVGLSGATVSLLPAVGTFSALRFPRLRSGLNWLLDKLIVLSRKVVKRPGPGAEAAFERLLERIGTLHLPRRQYIWVFTLSLWNWVADCLCLTAAISATGAHPPWRYVFFAYGAGMSAASIGLTPGGLGVMELALVGSLVAAGLPAHHALAAVLVYRLISFWLVMTGGWVIVAFLGRRAQRARDRTTPTSGNDPSRVAGRAPST
jgi:putative heme transporter